MPRSSAPQHTSRRPDTRGDERSTQDPSRTQTGESWHRKSLTADQIEAWATGTLPGPGAASTTGPALVPVPAAARGEDVSDEVPDEVPDESLLLAAHPSVTTTARHFVTGWAARHHLPTEISDTLELLTSEIVGNAVIHGRGPICLTIGSPRRPAMSATASGAGPTPQLLPDAVLVQVHDTSPHQPQVQALTPDLTGGRGLAMVELLARQWGVSRPDDPAGLHSPDRSAGVGGVSAAGAGKTVWFVLSA